MSALARPADAATSIDTAILADALRRELPGALADQVPVLTDLLAAALSRRITIGEAQQHAADMAQVEALLTALAGRQFPLATR